MCCFSQPVEIVSATKIFARGLADGSQYLVYSMNVAAKRDLAMILPLPVPAASPEDAVRFIDLTAYADLFEDLKKGFPAKYEPLARGGGSALLATSAPTLRVHEVGSFEASFVPNVADFNRLDARFRLPKTVWARLPQYRDYGFAVFKLKGGGRGLLKSSSGARSIHPMAFQFPRRNGKQLFFPTLHIHDGTVHAEADFDHALYCQHDREPNGWERSERPAGAFVSVARALGIVDGDAPCHRLLLEGFAPNTDTLVS